MPTFIAFWNYVPDRLWQKKPFADRLNCLSYAVLAASNEARLKSTSGDAWIFVSPEYTFAGVEPSVVGVDDRKAAIPASTRDEESLLGLMSSLTRRHEKLLLAPGTIAVKEHSNVAPQRVRNTSHAYYAGDSVWRFNKASNLGELSRNDVTHNRFIFKAGLGYDTATVEARTYGAEICRDATNGGTLPRQVQRQVVLAAGAAHGETHDYVANKATELQIIADWGNPSVYDYRGAWKARIDPYRKVSTEGQSLQYYVVN